jgi:predicted PurR-regulated permease PerM
MNPFLSIPGYIKGTIFLLGLFLLVNILSIAGEIILPFLYATLLAILFSPVVHYLELRKIHRTLAIGGVLIIFIILFSLLMLLVFSQVSLLSDALPELANKFDELLKSAVRWASENFNISTRKINAWLTTTSTDFYQNSGAAIGSTLTTIGGLLVTLLLTPVYVFMLLYYQSHLVKFSHKLFGAKNRETLDEIFTQTKTLVQSYLVGLFVEFVIIAVLNAVGLLLLGINYAILLGILGALLNIIPYVGGLVGVVMFMLIAMVTKEPQYMIYVVVLYTVIQFIDNNFIVPKVVGSKVKLNALVSLVAVLCGAALWGIPGMFLSIPIIAILKLLFDRIDPLKSWGFLLGEIATVPSKRN